MAEQGQLQELQGWLRVSWSHVVVGVAPKEDRPGLCGTGVEGSAAAWRGLAGVGEGDGGSGSGGKGDGNCGGPGFGVRGMLC